MAHLLIVRGLPGSGKSTFAKSIKGYSHYEADQHFTDASGNYRFDRSKLREAHEDCQDRVKRALDHGDNVVVSNTFTQLWEIKPYTEMGHPYTIVTCEGNYGNIHGVPDEAVKRMADRWEFV